MRVVGGPFLVGWSGRGRTGALHWANLSLNIGVSAPSTQRVIGVHAGRPSRSRKAYRGGVQEPGM